jgi:hypothetical protein
MSTITTPAVDHKYDGVCDAIKDVHDEASLWKLSDEIVRVAPQGVAAVDAIVDQAKARGIPTKSTNTLRLYRDVAIRFPATERVALVSFSAHREAIAIGDVSKARQVLIDLAAKHGAAGVTVTTVKSAIGAATGKVPTAPKSGKAGTQSTYADVGLDLMSGGKAFIRELGPMVEVKGVTLDGIHAGLVLVLAAVEAKRVKAARKVAASKSAHKAASRPVVDPKRSAAAATARAAASKAASGKRTPVKAGAAKAGDLRDL